jgi:hypothetical protein
MYDTATGIIICVLINQFPTQAYQVSIQLLSNILNSSVGFSENKPEVGHLAVYPNPSRENLIITTPESEIEYTLINAQGMAVHSGITDCIINLKNLAEGMYFLRVRSNNSYRTFKIIKE